MFALCFMVHTPSSFLRGHPHGTLRTLQCHKKGANDYFNKTACCFTLLFNDILTKQSMPLTMRQATISLLPKPSKDHSEMTNFRPISMLNNDYKLFTKILVMRMETALSSLIHIDQAGFIKG